MATSRWSSAAEREHWNRPAKSSFHSPFGSACFAMTVTTPATPTRTRCAGSAVTDSSSVALSACCVAASSFDQCEPMRRRISTAAYCRTCGLCEWRSRSASSMMNCGAFIARLSVASAARTVSGCSSCPSSSSSCSGPIIAAAIESERTALWS